MNKNKLAWIGLLLVLPLVLSAASCQRQAINDVTDDVVDDTVVDDVIDDQTGDALDDLLSPGNTQTPPPSGLADPDMVYSKVVAETKGAVESIRLIQPDAVLTAIATKYRNSLSDVSGLLTNYYIFTSPSEPGYYYLINVPRDGLSRKVRFIIPIQDFGLEFDLMPIPYDEWKISYAKALQLAEIQGGGAEFRAKHQDFEVSAILAIPVAQHFTWSITYKAADNSGDLLRIQVDANTGTVQIIPPSL